MDLLIELEEDQADSGHQRCFICIYAFKKMSVFVGCTQTVRRSPANFNRKTPVVDKLTELEEDPFFTSTHKH